MLTPEALGQVAPLINGRSIPTESEGRHAGYNPATGKKLGDIPEGCARDVEKAVVSARASFIQGAWSKAPPSHRKGVLNKWADLIQNAAVHLDALDALEMGKPVSVPVFNAVGAAAFVRFNAEAIDKVLGDVFTSDSTSTVIQKRTPRGVVAAIIPWNFPTYNVVLKAAPALAAGNSVILKPSELASRSALILAQLALEAGIPSGVLNFLPGCGETVGKTLGLHMDVDMVTFTGSTAVGKLMLQYAGLSNLKVVNAECGGKSPQIMFNDGVNLDAAADNIAAMISLNQGQVCSAGSRLLVQESAEEALVQKVIARLEKGVAGDPQLATTSQGPLVSRGQLDKVLSFIDGASSEGADLIHGGARILQHSGGYFIEPAVFVNVPEHSRIAQQEVFGPVLSVLRFRDLEDAVRLANATCYGLAAYVWTSRMDIGFQIANMLSTGVTMVNACAPAGEGPAHAFSGEPFKLSGVGAEGGMAGLQTYMRRQTIWFNHG